MAKTTFGFQVRVVGAAPQAARYGGFSRDRTVWLSLLIGGGLAGLAGIFEAAGPFGQMVPQFPTGYGFTAIIVAFLGRLHPIGIVILGGLVLAVTYVGGESAQATLGLPSAATGVFQAMLLFFLLATDILITYRLRLRRRAGGRRDGRRSWISIVMTIVGGGDAAAARGARRAGGREVGRPEPRRRGDDADRRGHRLRGDLAAPARRCSASSRRCSRRSPPR